MKKQIFKPSLPRNDVLVYRDVEQFYIDRIDLISKVESFDGPTYQTWKFEDLNISEKNENLATFENQH